MLKEMKNVKPISGGRINRSLSLSLPLVPVLLTCNFLSNICLHFTDRIHHLKVFACQDLSETLAFSVRESFSALGKAGH